MSTIQTFDGHNDVLLRLFDHHRADAVAAFIEGRGDGQLDLPRARQGGLVGGLFAIFAPSREASLPGIAPGADGFHLPLPPELPLAEAQQASFGMAAILLRLVAESDGAIRLCRSRAEIDAAVADGALATVMHIEGAEAIDTDFYALEVLYEAGLRSIGPVWSRANAFGHGVPFRFPSSPDLGPGLTDAGKELVRLCNQKKILVDLSHLNEQGFWDVAATSTAPLVATHSNVHALCPSSRNLTDRQLDAIAERDGLVGLNFATCFIREDGAMRADTGLDLMARHLDYLIDRLGEDRVGFGSDFDGAGVPHDIGSVAGLPVLIDHLRGHGYDEALLAKIAKDNWLSLLERTIG